MYHIKDDKRCQASALKIYNSIRHICKTKKLESITVTDIQKESKVSRSTFYRNFDNVVDALEWRLDYFFKEYMATKSGEAITFFFTYWDKHSDLIYLLTKENEATLKAVIKKHQINPENDVLLEYLLNLKISVMTSLLCKWVERNKKESIAEMVKITNKIFSIKFANLLTDF